MNKGHKIEIKGRPKRPRRKPIHVYEKKFGLLQEGRITRVSIYNWWGRCSKRPVSYIHSVYKGRLRVIEQDDTGFIVICLKEKNKWPCKTA